MATRKPTTAKQSVNKDVKEATTTVDAVSELSAPIVPKDVDPTTIITVKNGFQGKLIYISPRTRERFVWDEFGDEQEMELRELRNAKSSAKKFFENNWFMFDDDYAWVIDYLGLGRYYKYAAKLEDFDTIFDKSPEEIKEIVDSMSVGQKKSLSYRTRQLVADGEIDSRKVIAALEEALDVELIER